MISVFHSTKRLDDLNIKVTYQIAKTMKACPTAKFSYDFHSSFVTTAHLSKPSLFHNMLTASAMLTVKTPSRTNYRLMGFSINPF